MKNLSAQQWQSFYQQLQRLVAAGLSLLEALQVLTRHGVDKAQQVLSCQLAQTLLQGLSLAAAARRCSVFGEFDVALLEVGELTGRLDVVFGLLLKHYQRQQQLSASLKKALSYPCFLLIVAAGMVTMMVLWLIPQFATLFLNFGAQLPWLTRHVLALAQHFASFLVVSFMLSIMLVVIFRVAWRYQRYSLECCLHRLPLIGSLWQVAIWQRLCQVLGLLLAAGLPLMQALTVSTRVVMSHLYRQALQFIAHDIQQGQSLARAFDKQRFFAIDLLNMLVIGENTGRLDEVLLQQAEIYEQQLLASLDRLAKWLEPLVLLCAGGIVGVIMVALYLPIFSLGSVV
jgi:type II secretory pathway component PulF